MKSADLRVAVSTTGASPVFTVCHKENSFIVNFSILSEMAYYLAVLAPVVLHRFYCSIEIFFNP